MLRCIRFYRDYAGGRDLNVFGIHQRVYFGNYRDATLENEFSGNLVEVCPTGVFTDKTLKRHSPGSGTCRPHRRCGALLRRMQHHSRRAVQHSAPDSERYNRQVNGYFLCDRGRFGYEFVNSDRRIRKTAIRAEIKGPLYTITVDEALSRVRKVLSESKGVLGIGSPRASLESNFMLRTLVGPSIFLQGYRE